MHATIPLAHTPNPAHRGRRRVEPFFAPRNEGARIPEPLAELVEAMLAPFGNREACWRLFIHYCLVRFGGWRTRAMPFTVVPEYLADGPLRLTLAQLEGGIETLAKIGIIERVTPKGEGGRQKGRPRRLPVQFRFPAWVQQALQDADADARDCRRRRLAVPSRPAPAANAEKGRSQVDKNPSKASGHLPASRQHRPRGPLCPPDPRRQQAEVDLAALRADPRPLPALSAGALTGAVKRLRPFMPPGAGRLMS